MALPNELFQRAAIQHPLPKTRRERLACLPQKKKSRFRRRKPYQVAITLSDSSGHSFKRVRGWRQPVRTAMMLKNRVKTTQRRLDTSYAYQEQLDMLRHERQFLSQLGAWEDTSECGKLSFVLHRITRIHDIKL